MRYFLWAVCIVGIPVLMIALSLWIPPIRNPLFLAIGVVVGFVLPRSWLRRRSNGL